MTQKRFALGLVLILVGLVALIPLIFYQPQASQAYTMDQAATISEEYLQALDDDDLAIGEIMEFEQNFYVVYYEKSTGIGAFEMLIDKATGRIFPEYGPNMMWNTKYGHGGMMGGWDTPPSGDMHIDQADALHIAQDFLNGEYPGTIAEDAHTFYGYYTVHVTKDGEVYGMLSVNGSDGTVWYHNWHGSYIQSREMHN